MFGYGYGPGMTGWWGGYGMMGGFGVFWLLIVVLLVGGVIWFMRSYPTGQPTTGHSGGLDVLEQRYARGEINRDEYLQKKSDLQA